MSEHSINYTRPVSRRFMATILAAFFVAGMVAEYALLSFAKFCQ